MLEGFLDPDFDRGRVNKRRRFTRFRPATLLENLQTMIRLEFCVIR